MTNNTHQLSHPACFEGLAGALISMMEDQIMHGILGLPFIREMMEGTLNQNIFRFYIIQDTIYLQTFSKIFVLAATKIDLLKEVNGEAQYLFLLEQSKGALEEAANLHHEYFKKWNIDSVKDAKASKSCLLYTSFLLASANSDTFLQTLCSCLPCYYIYYRVAQYITNKMMNESGEVLLTDSHPYADWIKSYSSDEFKKGVEQFSAFINTYAPTASESEKEKCFENVKMASQMEYLFWDSAYYLEEWPVEEIERRQVKNLNPVAPKSALTIAGSDSGGGAGIQADLNTFHAHHLFGTSAITALTAQNTLGVQGVFPVSAEFLAKQIDSVMSDINIVSVKTGMLYSSELIRVVIEKLKHYRELNPNIKVVVDPVMVSTSGHNLLKDEAVDALVREFFPMATLITPNIPEAERILELTDSPFKITTVELSKKAAKTISETFGIRNVLVKGGHLINSEYAVDILYESEADRFVSLHANFIQSNNTHGTGCSLAAAIASNLALGSTLEDAVRRSKLYVLNAIVRGFNPSQNQTGHGTLNHKLF
ncbi:predicted protein [Naegleria gruberi]|uniref:Predicted protein n=1 Tax=Naegleria gruberi TaxID=5762 RepID=D2V558_NAEGR|nr:uncharacterized protein NAEGRDRAFT_64022 [Naegleria gruberi]EFC48217.1 predicted protein [Naegleria gruberi]|eukprot:XP_002680961.1 predicted protein [Naegleria gruberi strain NEG-M]